MIMVIEKVKKTFLTPNIYIIPKDQHLINTIYQYESLGTIYVLCAF